MKQVKYAILCLLVIASFATAQQEPVDISIRVDGIDYEPRHLYLNDTLYVVAKDAKIIDKDGRQTSLFAVQKGTSIVFSLGESKAGKSGQYSVIDFIKIVGAKSQR